MKALSREQWLFCLQIGLSMILAYFVTHGRDPTNAIYAVLGAGLVTAPSVGEGVGVSRDRIIGTLLGALVSLASMWLHHPALALGATIVIVAPLGMMLGGIAVTRVAVTVMAVTVVLHTETAGSYGFYRFTNTVAGVAVALAVSFLFWPLAGKLTFSSTMRAVLIASAKLAEQLASWDLKSNPLDAQRKVFSALSALPKSITNLRLDPLLYRQRGRLQQETQLVIKIAIALLSSSLALARVDVDSHRDELVPLGVFFRRVAARLHWTQLAYPSGAALAPGPAEAPPVLAVSAAMPIPILEIIDELLTIDRWLDELQSLLLQNARKRP